MNMDMGSSSSMSGMGTSMAGMTATSTASASMETGMSMGGMGGMGGGACKINMLWNWYTIDACFLTSDWHITSHGMFAGSCIGVICLVVVLELLRRLQREYDRYLTATTNNSAGIASRGIGKKVSQSSGEQSSDSASSTERGRTGPTFATGGLFNGRSNISRPTIIQQAIRATIHMLQFAVAYFVMLLAMYYNGYIIICIFIGAWIGAFALSWDQLAQQGHGDALEVTGCCG